MNRNGDVLGVKPGFNEDGTKIGSARAKPEAEPKIEEEKKAQVPPEKPAQYVNGVKRIQAPDISIVSESASESGSEYSMSQ